MRRAGRVPDEADRLVQVSDIVDAVEKVRAAENRPARLLNRARTRGSDPREWVATHTHRRGLTRVQRRGVAPCYFFRDLWTTTATTRRTAMPAKTMV